MKNFRVVLKAAEKSGPQEKKKTDRKSKKPENAFIARLEKLNLDEANIPKNYQMQDKYALGDYIHHGTFGKGIVEGLIGSDKIKILFDAGVEKVLVHSRK